MPLYEPKERSVRVSRDGRIKDIVHDLVTVPDHSSTLPKIGQKEAWVYERGK